MVNKISKNDSADLRYCKNIFERRMIHGKLAPLGNLVVLKLSLKLCHDSAVNNKVKYSISWGLQANLVLPGFVWFPSRK